MITRHQFKACCGAAVFYFEADKPIKKHQLQHFINAGYFSPQNFIDAGVFYVEIGNKLIASASFGSTRISVRCNGDKCAEHLDSFQALLETAINL